MKSLSLIALFVTMATATSLARDPARAKNFPQLAESCTPSAPLPTIRAIVRAESDFYPLALSLNQPKRIHVRLARQPKSLQQALYWTHWLLEHNYTVSVGLMQINSVDAQQHGYRVEQLFDPCTNLKLGWQILSEKYQAPAAKYGHGQRALHEALSLYNSGSPRTGFSNGYVSHVIAGEFPGNSPHKKEVHK